MSPLGRRIEPFRGLLYNQRKCGDLSAVVAPPYDLIGPERQNQLYDRSPNNVVRLELNRDADRYGSSASTLRDWIDQNILEHAPAPAIYLYSESFAVEGRRLERDGFIVRIRLEEFGKGRILPHERTFSAPKEDRLRLLGATATNMSSIFGLYSGTHPELDDLRKLVMARPALMEVTDDLGVVHRLRAIDAPSEIALIQSALDDSRILIADGHHRYETALNYSRQMRAAQNNPAGPQPYDYTMMTLTACDDPGLVILPTHRVVKRLAQASIAAFAGRARDLFQIEEFSDSGALLERLKSAGHGTLAVALQGDARLRLIRLKDAGAMVSLAPEKPAAIRALDVSILHAVVFSRILGLEEAEVKAGGNIEYTIDAEAALKAVAHGQASGAFLLNATSIGEVERVSDSGATMPEKSTYFFPKLLTGLVMNPLND
ncbi:MAG: DUF1015 domain-containing protein [Candidatus Binataceae bacterium]|jgi:uncharacterized protein (DUF1015 family)